MAKAAKKKILISILSLYQFQFTKPNLLLYRRITAKACNELAVTISATYRQGNTSTA